jgi:hypothetical protein
MSRWVHQMPGRHRLNHSDILGKHAQIGVAVSKLIADLDGQISQSRRDSRFVLGFSESVYLQLSATPGYQQEESTRVKVNYRQLPYRVLCLSIRVQEIQSRRLRLSQHSQVHIMPTSSA